MNLPSSQSDSTDPRSRFINAADLETHYLEQLGEGPPVVLVHGGGAGADARGNWAGVMPRLPGRRVLAVDMVGFGATQKPGVDSGYEYSQENRDLHLAAVIEALCKEPVVLVGNSMGGLTALGVARKRPELVRRLVLMGSAGLPVPYSPALGTIIGYDYTLAGMARIVAALTAPGFEAPASLVDYRYQLSIRADTRYAYDRINDWNKARGGLHQPEESFSGIHTPTLVIAGKNDQVVPLSCAYRFLELLPDSTGYILPRCGHWPMLEHPQQFAAVLLAFMGAEQR